MSNKQSVTLTDNLVKQIKKLQEKEKNPDLLLRVAVNGGGCQGFEYDFAFEKTVNEDDHIFEKDVIRVVIDEMSLNLIDGSKIDFVEELTGSSFQVKNPQAKSSCGCGTSFSI
jgi:iron-sulfur cluster insertion protein